MSRSSRRFSRCSFVCDRLLRFEQLEERALFALGTPGDDVLTLRLSGNGEMFEAYIGDPPPQESDPIATWGRNSAAAVVVDTLGGNDLVVIDLPPGASGPTGGVRVEAGTGANDVHLRSGRVRLDGSAIDGSLSINVEAGAELLTSRFNHVSLTLAGPGAKSTILPGGGPPSDLLSLTIAEGATLDITDNAFVLDYLGASPRDAIREKIVSGRGGAGLGKAWRGMGITSSVAAEVSLLAPDSTSIAYAENAQLPLGPYSAFRGQAVDDTSVLVAYTRTGDANLDGLVNDDDVTIFGATYEPGISQPYWALGDFEYNGFTDDEDATLLGALYGKVPSQPSAVFLQADDRRLFVRDRLPDGTLGSPYAFVAKGVNWSPHTPGSSAADLHLEFARWYRTDLRLMAQMGVNVVRVYHDFGTGAEAIAILDEMHRHGIKVIMTVDSPRHGTAADAANIAAVVNAYKNHPSILMWSVGNEWDINKYYGTFATIQEAAAFTEYAAQLIKSLDHNHLVTTVIADPHIPFVHPLSPEAFPFQLARPYTSELVNVLVPSIDVWGLNIYRGASFGDAMMQWQTISTEPAFIGESGSDSYDHRVSQINAEMQSTFNAGLWDEVYYELSAERTNGTLIGAFSFEWNDEWWKNGSPAEHSITSEVNFGQPDGFNDEEFFGIVDIHRDPRDLFNEFRDRFTMGQDGTELNAAPVVEAISRFGATFKLNGKTVFSRGGGNGGGRGVNVAIVDRYTGIRMESIRNFDTWSRHERFVELADYLDSLPDGTIIAFAAGDEAGFINYMNGRPWNEAAIEQGYRVLEAFGSVQVRNVGYRGHWAMISIKGQGAITEDYANEPEPGQPAREIAIQVQLALALDPDFGRRSATAALTTDLGVPGLQDSKPVFNSTSTVAASEPVRTPAQKLPVRSGRTFDAIYLELSESVEPSSEHFSVVSVSKPPPTAKDVLCDLLADSVSVEIYRQERETTAESRHSAVTHERQLDDVWAAKGQVETWTASDSKSAQSRWNTKSLWQRLLYPRYSP